METFNINFKQLLTLLANYNKMCQREQMELVESEINPAGLVKRLAGVSIRMRSEELESLLYAANILNEDEDFQDPWCDTDFTGLVKELLPKGYRYNRNYCKIERKGC